MGFLRVYLAIVVIMSHCPQGTIFTKFSHPALAVQCFYAISGFYMQLLITQFRQHSLHWVRDFFINRVLRLFPTYFFILGLTFLLVPMPKVYAYLAQAGFTKTCLFWFNNVCIITQGLNRFWPFTMSVMQQSWTLSLEMLFYLLVPYLLFKSHRTIVLMIVASVVCRLWCVQNDLYLHQWFYEFFPNEIGIFLAGSLGYRFYQHYFTADAAPEKKVLLKWLCGGIFAYLFYFTWYEWNFVLGGFWDQKSSLGAPVRYWAVLLMTIGSLPFVFYFTKHSKWDRYLGEFSYPLYLGHFLVLDVMNDYVAPGYLNIVVIVITTLLSFFIMHAIEMPLASFRQKLKRRSTARNSSNLPGLAVERSR